MTDNYCDELSKSQNDGVWIISTISQCWSLHTNCSSLLTCVHLLLAWREEGNVLQAVGNRTTIPLLGVPAFLPWELHFNTNYLCDLSDTEAVERLVNCIFVNIPKHISCQLFVWSNVSHWFLNTFQFVFNNPFLSGVILLMGPPLRPISEPSLIQYEYLRLQLYINNVGQGQTGKRQTPRYFVLSMESKTKYLL